MKTKKVLGFLFIAVFIFGAVGIMGCNADTDLPPANDDVDSIY